MELRSHLHLTNAKYTTNGFKKTRNVEGNGNEEDEEIVELPKLPNPSHQARIKESYLSYISSRRKREQERKIQIPAKIDLLTINFYSRFNLDLQKKYITNYGLNVVSYENFNKSVLFTVDNLDLFETFKRHLQLFYNSLRNVTWQNTEYHLIPLIHDFEFHSTKKIIHSINETQSLFHLIDIYDDKSKLLNQALLNYIKSIEKTYQYLPEINLLEVQSLSRAEIEAIASSFDIVRTITSVRAERVKPSVYGTVIRDFGFTSLVDERNVKVGIIDTGVNKIEPLKQIVSNNSLDITATAAYWDENGHGTMVASIVAFGSEFYESLKERYISKAEIFVIKVLTNSNDNLSIIGIVNAIKEANEKHGVRIFNMSLNEPFAKKYNSTFSEYAYLLDKLAFENDLLIFISAGNTSAEHLKGLDEETHVSHEYPHHFYSLDSDSPIHRCELTNIASPSESLNNVTVGALAGNFENKAEFGKTPASELPAIYSRKFHYDYNQKVNGSDFMRSQKNKHLNKPDLVHYGGDLFDFEAGLEVLRSPMSDTEKYYSRSCGTSLATPLVTSIAAQILQKYPSLKTQSVKALLINSAFKPWGNNPILYRDVAFKGLIKKLSGFGMPNEIDAINSNDSNVTFIIEDEIKLEEFKSIQLNLPKYILETQNKLSITATLCYSFLPVRNNHLAYCPLQITLGCFKNNSVTSLANDNIKDNQIKSVVSWSDDFFGVENRVFSNAQKIEFTLSVDKIKELDNSLAIAIKCTGKKEIETVNLSNLKNTQHKFSVVLSVSELPINKAEGKLYNEMILINTVEAISIIENTGEATGTLEIE